MILCKTAEDISAFLYVYLDLGFNGGCQGDTWALWCQWNNHSCCNMEECRKIYHNLQRWFLAYPHTAWPSTYIVSLFYTGLLQLDPCASLADSITQLKSLCTQGHNTQDVSIALIGLGYQDADTWTITAPDHRVKCWTCPICPRTCRYSN